MNDFKSLIINYFWQINDAEFKARACWIDRCASQLPPACVVGCYIMRWEQINISCLHLTLPPLDGIEIVCAFINFTHINTDARTKAPPFYCFFFALIISTCVWLYTHHIYAFDVCVCVCFKEGLVSDSLDLAFEV